MINVKTPKVIFLGDTSVGKSCLISRYCQDAYDDHKKPTEKAYFTSIKVQNEFGNQFCMHIWDTVGSEEYRSMMTIHYREAHVAILLFDLQRDETLENLDIWESELHQNIEKCEIYIVGNKMDLLSFDEAQEKINRAKKKFSNINQNRFYLTSALTGDGVKDLFDSIINSIDLNDFPLDGQNNNDPELPKKPCC